MFSQSFFFLFFFFIILKHIILLFILILNFNQQDKRGVFWFLFLFLTSWWEINIFSFLGFVFGVCRVQLFSFFVTFGYCSTRLFLNNFSRFFLSVYLALSVSYISTTIYAPFVCLFVFYLLVISLYIIVFRIFKSTRYSNFCEYISLMVLLLLLYVIFWYGFATLF